MLVEIAKIWYYLDKIKIVRIEKEFPWIIKVQSKVEIVCSATWTCNWWWLIYTWKPSETTFKYEEMKNMSYQEISEKVIQLFFPELTNNDIKTAVNSAYNSTVY